MKKSLLSALCSLFISAPVFAACTPATPNEYKALVISTAIDRPELVQKLTSTYCYNLEQYDFSKIDTPHPLFISPTPIFLSYYLNTSRNFIDLKENASKLDILSFQLILPYAAYFEDAEQEKAEYLELLKKYDPKAQANWFEHKYQTISNSAEKYKDPEVWSNYNKMLDTLTIPYSKLLTLPQDSKNNSPFNYAVLTNQSKVVSALLNGPYYNLYKKNADGYTPFHLAFAKTYYAGSDEDKKAEQLKINTILVEYFKPERVQFLDMENVSFNAFMELLKENNTDLYEKIIAKQKQNNMMPEVEDVKLVEQNKDYYLTSMDYVKDYR